MKASVSLADAFDEVPLRGTTSICYPSPSYEGLRPSCMVLITKSGLDPPDLFEANIAF